MTAFIIDYLSSPTHAGCHQYGAKKVATRYHTKEGSIIVELQAHCFIEEIDRVFQDVLEIVYLIGR